MWTTGQTLLHSQEGMLALRKQMADPMSHFEIFPLHGDKNINVDVTLPDSAPMDCIALVAMQNSHASISHNLYCIHGSS